MTVQDRTSPSTPPPVTPFAADQTDGLPTPRRYWAHLAIGMSVSMAVIDGSIANVALPTIAHNLKTSPVSVIWVVNAYQLAICTSLMVIGSLGDIYGYARVNRYCVIVFTAASLGCALSHSLLELSIARFCQGLGGAGIMGVTNALLRSIYPRRELAVGIGRNTMILALALVLGPTVASAILSVGSWPYLFAINVPIGIVALLMSMWALPTQSGSRHKFDTVSAVLNVLAFGLLVFGIEEYGHGGPTLVILLELTFGSLALFALVRRQRNVASPLLPIDLLRIRMFALSISTTLLASMAQIMAYVAIPFLFQQTLGLSQVRTGLLITPWPLMVGLIGPFAGRLASRFPASWLSSIGLVIFAVAMLLLATLPLDASTIDIVWRMAVAGIGYGLFLPPNASTQISAAPKERSGGASSMGATARVVGQATGSAAVALMFVLAPSAGSKWSLVAAAAVALVGVAVSASRRLARQE